MELQSKAIIARKALHYRLSISTAAAAADESLCVFDHSRASLNQIDHQWRR